MDSGESSAVPEHIAVWILVRAVLFLYIQYCCVDSGESSAVPVHIAAWILVRAVLFLYILLCGFW